MQQKFMGTDHLMEDTSDIEGVSLLTTLLHPKSRWEIRLRTTDPTDQPLIDPRFLDEQADVDILVKVLWNLNIKMIMRYPLSV